MMTTTWGGPPAERRFPLVKVSDVAIVDGEVEYLIDELLPRTGLAEIWGPPKCGKSFWMLDTAMHVALGWAYRDRVVQQGTVIYLSLEGQSGMRKRVVAFLKHHFDERIPFIPFRLIMVPVTLVTDAKALIDEIQYELGEDGPALIVVDTLARAMIGSDSDMKEMSAFVRAADQLMRAFRCCVVVVHHTGWNGEHSRGSTALPAAVDVELSCNRTDDDAIVVKTVRAKDGPEDAEIVSRLVKVDTGKRNSAGKPIVSMVVVPADDVVIHRSRFSPDVDLAYEALVDCINERGQLVAPHLRIPKSARTIQMSEWLKTFEQMDTKERKPDTRRTAVERACRKLQKARMIGFWKPYVWLLTPPGHSGHSGHS